jgi:hypothetical protein
MQAETTAGSGPVEFPDGPVAISGTSTDAGTIVGGLNISPEGIAQAERLLDGDPYLCGVSATKLAYALRRAKLLDTFDEVRELLERARREGHDVLSAEQEHDSTGPRDSRHTLADVRQEVLALLDAGE